MTYPNHPGPSFWAAQIGEAVQHSLFFAEQLRSGQTSYCLLFNSSISITPTWGKQSNLWTPCVCSLRSRFPSWIWIRWIQHATHRNNFTSPPKLAMSTAMQNSAPTPSYFISGQHFLETFTLLPKTTRTTNSRWLQSFLSSNSKHNLCYTMANTFPSHTQQYLNLTMHFSLRHLAAKMLSQLYQNFISFPYFFPPYETCSININPLFHAAIKNLHIKPYGIFLLLHHPTLFSNSISKGITTRASSLVKTFMFRDFIFFFF